MGLNAITQSFHLSGEKVNFIPMVITSIAYFFFYPLFGYLVIYMGLTLSLSISFAVIGLLILNYMRILYGFKIGLSVFTAYIFYLGITSLAALLPEYTGLILTIEAVLLMGIIMQVLSQHKNLKIDELLGIKS